jgi:hypothetical protein
MKTLLLYAGLILGFYALFFLLPAPNSLEHTPLHAVKSGMAHIDLTASQHEGMDSAIASGWKVYLMELDEQGMRENRLAAALLLLSILSVAGARRMK